MFNVVLTAAIVVYCDREPFSIKNVYRGLFSHGANNFPRGLALFRVGEPLYYDWGS